MELDGLDSVSPVAAVGIDDALSLLDVTVTVSDPLPAGMFDTGTLPPIVTVGVARVPEPGATVELLGWNVRAVALGKAAIELDGYRLLVDDADASLTLENLSNGFNSRIWGEAGFEAGGEQIGPFWGTISLNLANDMIITAQTARDETAGNAYRLNTLTITRHANALIIQGLGGAETNDLSFTGIGDGRRVDDEVDDGLVLDEARTGTGWFAEKTTVAADAAYLELTAPGAEFGPDGNGWSEREFGRVLMQFSQYLTMTTSFNVDRAVRENTSALQRDSDLISARIRAELMLAEVNRPRQNARP